MGVDDIIAGALFYNNVLTSSLIHTQFAYATVNHDINPCSNNEPPKQSEEILVWVHSGPPSEGEPLYAGQTAVLDGVSIARYDHTSITHED